MKKLISILLATFFICTASYGATIKELLGGKVSINLLCTIEKAQELTWERHSNGDLYMGEKKLIL